MPNTHRSLLERTVNLGLVLVSILSLLGPLAPARAAGPGDGEPDGGRVIGAISTVIRCLSPAGTEPGSVEPGEEGMPCVSSGLVYLDWHGNIARARLALRVAGAEAPHTILVNGQRAASAPVLPSESPDAGEYVYLTLSPQVVVPGENRIELTDDAQPGDRWTAMNVRIEVFGSPSEADLAPLPKSGNVPAVDAIVADASIAATRMVISFTSPYDGSTQEAEIQIPDGYTGDTPTPLVVYAHGRSSVMSAGIDALGAAANARGWLLASPQMHGSWVVPEECYIYPNDCTYDDQTLAGTTNANAEPRPGAYTYASPESQYDIIGTIRYMIDRYNVKLDQMYLVGDSMGGQIAAVTGAKFPHLFAAVFDNKGPTDADVWYDEQVVLYGTDGAGTLRAMRKECHIGGDPKGPPDNPFCYEQRSGVEYAGNWLHVPISMTHSVDDALVPVHHSRDLRDAINGYGPDRVALLYEDTVVGPTCPPYSHCLVPDPAAVLGFLSAYTLDNAPAGVIATTDESKAFYWLNLVQSGGAHWSKVEAIADPATESVTVRSRMTSR